MSLKMDLERQGAERGIFRNSTVWLVCEIREGSGHGKLDWDYTVQSHKWQGPSLLSLAEVS